MFQFRLICTTRSHTKHTQHQENKTKQNEAMRKDMKSFSDSSLGGVFISSKLLESKGSTATIETDAGSTLSSLASSWKSSGDKEHNKNVPLFVSDRNGQVAEPTKHMVLFLQPYYGQSRKKQKN
jgi:hypothetical protein